MLRNKVLSFDVNTFASNKFDCTTFVRNIAAATATQNDSSSTSTTTTTLNQVRSDLQDHLTAIQNDLLSLVHRDYADFVQLSSELEGVDVTLDRCRNPLIDLHRATEQLRDAAAFSLETIQSGLNRHDVLENEHADMSEMLRALQILLLGEDLLASSSKLSDEDGAIEECALLERVSRIIAHVHILEEQIRSTPITTRISTTPTTPTIPPPTTTFDNADDTNQDRHEIVMMLQVRGSLLKRQLLKRLEVSYGTEVVPDSASGDLVVNQDAMLYCLRAYSSGTTDVAVEASKVFAKLVMSPFLNEFVTQGRLDGKGKTTQSFLILHV